MRAISWTAFLPNCGVAPCAALPRVSSSSHKLPLCAVTTCNLVGSPTMARIRLESAFGQRARTGLRVFLVNQSGEDNFRFERTRFGIRQFAKRGEHGGDGTFRVARAAAVKAAVFALRNEFRSVRADGVEVRREQNGLADFVSRQQPRDEIGTSGQNFLKFNFQSGARGGGGEKIRDDYFFAPLD
jgi:DNA invertase Pin-like site-specific DNA recombinase